MLKEEMVKNTKGKLNKKLLQADIPLLEKSEMKASNTSIARAPFPDKEKMSLKMILKIYKMMPAMTSFFTSVRIIKRTDIIKKYTTMDKNIHKNIVKILENYQVDNIGYVKLSNEDVFKHLAIPYKYAIIFTAKQDKNEILTSPSIRSQVEVGRIYGKTGNAANKLSEYLTKQGFGAMPSHSLGGVIDYTKLGKRAGFGEIGRHGLLIEPKSGPNHRLGAVFTNINNLDKFFMNDQDYSWIKEFCNKCGKCIKQCPAKAIKEDTTKNENGYITAIEYKKCEIVFASEFGCNICVAICPFTTIGYEKIKSSYIKQKNSG